MFKVKFVKIMFALNLPFSVVFLILTEKKLLRNLKNELNKVPTILYWKHTLFVKIRLLFLPTIVFSDIIKNIFVKPESKICVYP